MTQRRVLVTGAGGQLGAELARTCPRDVTLLARTRTQLDVTDPAAIEAELEACGVAAVINAAAYTAVDRAEAEREAAWAINAVAPAMLAEACARRGVRLIHVSTDFVFDGRANCPYPVDATAAPIGAYGESKLAGERAVLAAAPAALIIRTSWLYSCHGSNFVVTMLRLMAEREALTVVWDQVGTPTWARGLAEALWVAAGPVAGQSGVLHWSDDGLCSWYDFAVAIAEEALALGLLRRMPAVHPIPASQWPTPARRPAWSVLETAPSRERLGVPGHHWRAQLRSMLKELETPGG